MSESIRDAIAGLEPGTKVKLKLSDGQELVGTLAEQRGETVKLADAPAVGVEQVDDVLVQVVSDGPE